MADTEKANNTPDSDELTLERIDSMMDFGKRSPHISVAMSQRKKWADVINHPGKFGIAERVVNDVVNLTKKCSIKTNNEYDERILNKLIFTPNNIRMLTKLHFSNLAFGNALLTYDIDPETYEIKLQPFTVFDFIPKFDSFGNISDVAMIYNIPTPDPENPMVTVLKYCNSGESMIFYKTNDGEKLQVSAWAVTDIVGIQKEVFYETIQNFMAGTATNFKWEIFSSTIVDSRHFYGPYNKSLFHRVDLIDEIEDIYKLMKKDLIYSEKIIFLDRTTFAQLKDEDTSKPISAEEYTRESDGKSVKPKERLSGIYKIGSLKDELVKEIQLTMNAPVYMETIDWMNRSFGLACGLGADFYNSQQAVSEGAGTAQEANIRLNRQLMRFLNGYRWEAGAALADLFQDALLHLPEETGIPQMVMADDITIEWEDLMDTPTSRMESGANFASAGLISKREWLQKYYKVSDERADLIIEELMAEAMNPLAEVTSDPLNLAGQQNAQSSDGRAKNKGSKNNKGGKK